MKNLGEKPVFVSSGQDTPLRFSLEFLLSFQDIECSLDCYSNSAEVYLRKGLGPYAGEIPVLCDLPSGIHVPCHSLGSPHGKGSSSVVVTGGQRPTLVFFLSLERKMLILFSWNIQISLKQFSLSVAFSVGSFSMNR